MPPIPHVVAGRKVRASEQNALIDRVNENTDDIAALQAGGGDPGSVQELIDESLSAHATDPTPHPAYDDLPSLTLLFENGLV